MICDANKVAVMATRTGRWRISRVEKGCKRVNNYDLMWTLEGIFASMQYIDSHLQDW